MIDAEKNIKMSYDAQAISKRLQDARAAKGLSQRELSKLAGVPQGQISRIEAGAVDLRLSSLAALAHALDLELTLVPRKALPAVHSLIRQAAGTRSQATSAFEKTKAIRNTLAHSSIFRQIEDEPKPAYSLDEDDDG
ncbi:helix-turn-helix domain-containing protein [Pelagibius sp. Alg239-R121]|uniref:helix-turn-helix domain-containing protein n=1 Tax=Pelagibius sp. Alg239-R121 TaxID=2993448 RepID=UPI0024A66EC8|nr:helix-turn-helix transcriptional regulator [Pelagibius sp. Alg239-R121]